MSKIHIGKIHKIILFQGDYFGYEKLVKNQNVSHVMFLLGIAVLFWVMDRQVRSEIHQQYYMFFVSLLFLLCLDHSYSTSICDGWITSGKGN